MSCCRLPRLLHRGLATSSPSSPSVRAILATPTWSVNSLFTDESCDDDILPEKLHHLLRLSALPLPSSPAEQDAMTATIRRQLRFVQAVQQVDTSSVEPLRAIRDETDAAVRESTIGVDALADVLAKEVRVGHYQRPRRVKEKTQSPAEDWDALAAASRTAGKYFVVESKPQP